MKRRLIEVPAGWLTPEGQKQRAKRIARLQSRTLMATPGEMAIARQMRRAEAERRVDDTQP